MTKEPSFGPPDELTKRVYSNLPAHAVNLKDSQLSTLEYRMQAIKDYLKEQFALYQGKVIYPFALADLQSVFELRKLFPRAHLVMNDVLDPNHMSNLAIAGARPSSVSEIIEFLRNRFEFDRTSEWRSRHQIEAMDFQVRHSDAEKHILDVHLRVNTSDYSPDRIPTYLRDIDYLQLEYRIQDFFTPDPEMQGLVFLRRPGWQGTFMGDARLWDRIDQILDSEHFLLIQPDQGYELGAPHLKTRFAPLLVDPFLYQVKPSLPLLRGEHNFAPDVYSRRR